MPKLAEELIKRRRMEAMQRNDLRRIRRELLCQLCIVLALTVPVIAVLLLENAPINIGPEHIHVIPPSGTLPPEDVLPATVGESAVSLYVADDVSASGGALSPPAPRAVARIAARHGGSPTSRWVALECDDVAELVRQHGMPAWMTTVAWRESRCRHDVTNFDRRTADRSYGLFQINVLGGLWEESRDRCGIRQPEQLLDPYVNVSCAAALYRAYGYQPWDSGRYFTN
jgi:hypothetical protein